MSVRLIRRQGSEVVLRRGNPGAYFTEIESYRQLKRLKPLLVKQSPGLLVRRRTWCNSHDFNRRHFYKVAIWVILLICSQN
jgi:hypothetical protein